MATALQPDLDTSEEMGAGSKTYPGGAAPPPAGAPALSSPMAREYMPKIESMDQQLQADYAAKDQAESPFRQKIMQMLQSPEQAQAHLQKVKEEPKPEDYQKNAKAFVGAMAVLGAIAGRGTRNAGNAALNAFTGAITGWKEGNAQNYENATKQWEEETKKTLENNKTELEQYKEIMQSKKANIDQMMAAMELAGAQYQNKIIMDAAAAKNYTLAFSAVDKMENAYQKTQTAFDKQKELKAKQDEKNHTNAKWLASPEGQSWVSQQPPGEQAKYKAFVEQFGQGTPRSAPAMALRKFIQENPDATPEQITQFASHYGAEVKATRDFGTGKQGDAVKSFSVALDHLTVAEQLGHALQNKDSQALNQISNLAKQQFGWEGAVDFNFAKKIVGDEITKSILGSGAGTGQDREDIQKAFSAANSPQQLAGVIKTAKRLMAGQLHGLKQQYEQTTGQTDFDSRLSDAARKELGGGTGAGQNNDGWGDVKVH